MTTEQQMVFAERPVLAMPESWPARRNYQRAQQLAQRLGLEDCQAVFLAAPARKAAWWYRWAFYYVPVYLAAIAGVILCMPFATSTVTGGLVILFAILLLIAFLPYMMTALLIAALRRSYFHCEQIHLYANGFIAIDKDGSRQGARWEQLFDFRRGSHEEDRPMGRVRWNTIRSAIANPRRGQRPTLKITPQLPDSTEICARIERAYTDYWLPRFRQQFAAGEVLDFDALLLQRDRLGKNTPGRRRYSASIPRPPVSRNKHISIAPGMARGQVTWEGTPTPVEWLRRNEVKSIRIDERFILIRTVEPVRRDNQGRADRLWFQLDTLSLKDAAILKEILPEFLN